MTKKKRITRRKTPRPPRRTTIDELARAIGYGMLESAACRLLLKGVHPDWPLIGIDLQNLLAQGPEARIPRVMETHLREWMSRTRHMGPFWIPDTQWMRTRSNPSQFSTNQFDVVLGLDRFQKASRRRAAE